MAGTHLAMQGQELLQVCLQVPGVQRDLCLPQEGVSAETVVVPHRELQSPRQQQGPADLVLGTEESPAEQMPSATAHGHDRSHGCTGACSSCFPCLLEAQSPQKGQWCRSLSSPSTRGLRARTHGIHHTQLCQPAEPRVVRAPDLSKPACGSLKTKPQLSLPPVQECPASEVCSGSGPVTQQGR